MKYNIKLPCSNIYLPSCFTMIGVGLCLMGCSGSNSSQVNNALAAQVDSVQPLSAYIGDITSFKVLGRNLDRATISFEECQSLEIKQQSTTSIDFNCTPINVSQGNLVVRNNNLVMKSQTISFQQSTVKATISGVTPKLAVIDRAQKFALFGTNMDQVKIANITNCSGAIFANNEISCTPTQVGEQLMKIWDKNNRLISMEKILVALPTKVSKTGVTTCSLPDGTKSNLPCDKTNLGEFYGKLQDGEVQAGEDMVYEFVSYNNEVCVKDKGTGLVWEYVRNDAPNHDANMKYIFRESGGRCFGGKCEMVEDHLDSLNKASYCGLTNWRVPTQSELISLIDYGKYRQNEGKPLVNAEYFPDIKYADGHYADGHDVYFTSSIMASYDYDGILGVFLNSGKSIILHKRGFQDDELTGMFPEGWVGYRLLAVADSE